MLRYWATDYDWRKGEAKLKALPHFMTTIDGVDIHFIHVRSKHANALPVIITHGWPGSVIEQLKVIDPLTNPTAHGGRAEDAFDVVIPSIPGYGFSGKPTTTGWDPIRIARAWVVLMQRLGYTKYVAQGGDWGDAVSEQMALLAPPELLGIHVNMPATVPADISKALKYGEPAPSSLSAEELHAFKQLDSFFKTGLGYAIEMANRPQTLYGIEDSPVGLAAWILDHDARSQSLIARVFDGHAEGLTRDDILDNITFYWLTQTAVVLGTPVLGKQAGLLRRQERHHPGGRERLSRMRSTRLQRAGRNARFPTSSTTTSSTRAATSRPGSSRGCSSRSFARASGRCAERPRASGCARGGGRLVRGPPAMRRLPRYAAASGAACPTRTDSRNCSRSSSSPRSSFSRSSKTPPNGRALRPRAVAVSTRFWEMCPASATIMR